MLCDTYFKVGEEELFTAVRKENSSDLSVMSEWRAQHKTDSLLAGGKNQSWCPTPSIRHMDQKLQHLHSFSPNGNKTHFYCVAVTYQVPCPEDLVIQTGEKGQKENR